MQLRWSSEAADDLERITNYLFKEMPQHAPDLVRAIYNAPQSTIAISPSRAARQEGGDAGTGAFTAALHCGLSNRRWRYPARALNSLGANPMVSREFL
jgi:hypothetical protein